MHDAAGVTPVRHNVEAGHHVVRQIATSGTPVPPAPIAVPRRLGHDQPQQGQSRSARGAAGRLRGGSGPGGRYPRRPHGTAPGRPSRSPSAS
jgi:hypothetical protein